MCGERTPYMHRHVVCVCVYVSQSKREIHPFPQEGGREIEWPYIHKEENHPVPQGGGGRVLLLLWPARWGEGMPQEAEHKTAAVGEGMPQKQRDILFHRAKPQEGYPIPQGGGRIHHDVHYLY